MDFSPLAIVEVKTDFFATDHLGNLYFIKGDQVEKFSSAGEIPTWRKENSYSNKLLGNISSIDASNPMKLLLFYKNQSQVIFLDNTLSEQGEPVPLQTLELEQGSLVCSSINNGLWIYDQRNFQLVRLTHNLSRIAETGNIILQAGGELFPDFLVERNNWVYLNDPERGILIFDIYGTFSRIIPVKKASSLHLTGDFVFFEREKKFYGLSLKTLEEKEIEIPAIPFKQLSSEGKFLYVLEENGLRIYPLKEKN